MQDDSLSLIHEGKVYLFESLEGTAVDITVDLKHIIKVDVIPTLCPVLVKLVKKYSLIKSKFLFLPMSLLGSNS
jgi:hypothetical protein